MCGTVCTCKCDFLPGEEEDDPPVTGGGVQETHVFRTATDTTDIALRRITTPVLAGDKMVKDVQWSAGTWSRNNVNVTYNGLRHRNSYLFHGFTKLT